MRPDISRGKTSLASVRPEQGNKMERMGPEASLMMSSAIRRSDLAEFARLEYSRAEARRVEATVAHPLGRNAAGRSVSGRLFGWFYQLVRREDARSSDGFAVRGDMTKGMADGGTRFSRPLGAGLATLPAQAALAPGGRTSPLSVVPAVGRS